MTKKTNPAEIWGKGLHRNEKFLGDLHLKYADKFDRLSSKARFIMFGGLMSQAYMFYQYSEYESFSRLVGNLVMSNLGQEMMEKMNADPAIMNAITKRVADEKRNEGFTHYG